MNMTVNSDSSAVYELQEDSIEMHFDQNIPEVKAQYPVQDIYTLSDNTEIGKSTWAVLKKDAMKTDYKFSFPYVSSKNMN